MRFFSMLLVFCCALAGQLFSQNKKTWIADSSATFDMYMGRNDQGTETYKLVQKRDHYFLTSTVRLGKYGEPVFSEQEQELAADWSPLHYSLKTRIAKENRTTEASRIEGKIQMRSASGPEVKSKAVDLRAPALIFDSVVPSQFQVLIHAYMAFNVQQPLNFQMLVPQVMAEFSGTLSPSGTNKGTLGNHPVELRKYTLISRGANLQIWADTKGELMRVALPAKNIEFIRAGFTMAGMPERRKQKSVVMLR